MSFFVNREWRERNNSGAGRYGPPPGLPTNLYQLQSTPSWMIRATENWVISDRLLHRFAFGYNRFGNANRSVYFNDGWPSKIGLTNQPDTTFPRFAITGASAILGTLGNYGSLNRNETFEGSTIIQDDLTIIMGKHSIKTGFEGRFYYLESEDPDGTASFNFNSAQTNLPGFDTQTGHAYGSFLLGAVATSSRTVQIVNNSYYQNNYDFYVQDDYKVSSKLTLNLGMRWQILPGMTEKNGYITNLDLTLPNTAAGNRPGALRFADQEGKKSFIDTYYGQFQPRLGVAYAVSPQMALSGGYSSSNRPAIAYADGENFVTLNSHGYNGSISITRATRPTPNSQDPVMSLSEPYPNLTGTFPNYDPTQLNNQGVGTVLRGDEARRERYNNYNVTMRRQLPANFSTTVAYIGAYGTRLPFMPLSSRRRQRDQSHAVRRGRTVWRSAVQQPVGAAGTRHSAAVSGFHRHRAAGAAALSAVHERQVAEQLSRQDAIRLAAGDAGTALQGRLRGARRLHLVEDARQRLHTGRIG